MGKGCPPSKAQTSTAMSPKAKRGKDEGKEKEQADEGKKPTGAALKKTKKEQCEQDEGGPQDSRSIAEKKELDKMYQAMKYENKKGNKHPLEAYNKLTSKKDKAEFYAKYLKDKKFEWVSIDETTEVKAASTSASFKGWVTKFQVADFEKIPVGHPLLESKLASLPSRAHPIQQWKDAGEQEYWYESGTLQRNEETMSHGLKVQGHGSANPKAVDGLLQGLPSAPSVPHKAIEDGGPPEKDEGGGAKEEEEDDDDESKKDALLEEWNELKGKLQKATRTMGDLCMEAQTIQGALGHKSHLEGLVAKVRENLAVLEPAKQKALEALGLMNTISVKDTKAEEVQVKLKELGELHEECVTHIEGFKKGAFKEAKTLLRNM